MSLYADAPCVERTGPIDDDVEFPASYLPQNWDDATPVTESDDRKRLKQSGTSRGRRTSPAPFALQPGEPVALAAGFHGR
jgi:hypothetical protein